MANVKAVLAKLVFGVAICSAIVIPCFFALLGGVWSPPLAKLLGIDIGPGDGATLATHAVRVVTGDAFYSATDGVVYIAALAGYAVGAATALNWYGLVFGPLMCWLERPQVDAAIRAPAARAMQ